MAARALSDFDPDRLEAANVRAATGLATDYLNHFNEAAMLVAMLADMPEAAGDVLAWAPRGYVEHFRATGFRDADLVADAFACVAPDVRAAFDAACAAVEHAIGAVQSRLAAGDDPAGYAQEAAAALYDLIGAAGGVINGAATPDVSADQQAIDALFD